MVHTLQKDVQKLAEIAVATAVVGAQALAVTVGVLVAGL